MLHLPRNLHFEVYKMLRLPRNLHFEVHKVLRLQQDFGGSQKCCACHEACKQATCPKVTLHCACHEIRARVEDHHRALKCRTCHEICISKYHRSDPLRLLRKVDFAPPTRKVTTISENVRGTTTRAQSRQAPAADTQILRACAVEMHFEDFERHECTVNSSEIAGPDRATP